jgi:hypothetical protein
VKSPTSARPRKGIPYHLDIVAANGGTQTRYFDTLPELSQAVKGAWHNHDWQRRFEPTPEHTTAWAEAHLRAYSRRGKALDVPTLYANARPTWCGLGRYPSRGYTRRRGSVYAISKWRGGPSYRNSRTMPERRLNAAWCVEEGEVECRPTRRDAYLFNSWDGRARATERGWKSQRKGRKAWDR